MKFLKSILFFSLLLPLVSADVKSTNGTIHFDPNSDGSHKMTLNSTGLGIGDTSPSANLSVQGNAIISGELSIGGSTSNSNLNINGTFSQGFQTVSSNITAGNSSLLLVDTDTAGANLTITLPDAQDYPGRVYNIKKVTSAHDVYIHGFIDSSEEINLASNTTLPFLSVISNGSTWSVLSQTSGLDNQSFIGSSNLFSYWKFDDASGNIATDSSGNDRQANLISMDFSTDSTDGVIQSALAFDGSTDYLSAGDLDELELTTLSFSFWMQINNTTQDHDFITKGIHTTSNPLLIWFDDSNGGGPDSGASNSNTISVLSYDGSTQHWVMASTNAINDTNWHHIVAVLDTENNTISIYIDGTLNISNTKSWNGIGTGSQTLRVGTSYNSANFIDGSMDDVRIYNKALSSDEVSIIYRMGLQ